MEKRREEKRREEKITQTCFIEFFLCHYLKITTRTSCSSLFPLYERDEIKIGAAKYERRKHEMKEKIHDCVMIHSYHER